MSAPPILVDLGQAPRLSYGFLWADYAELICLTSEDGLYSPGFLKDVVQEEEDIRADALADDSEESALVEALLAGIEADGMAEVEVDSGRAPSNRDVDSKIERLWDSIRRRLEVRRQSLGEYWPFSFQDSVLECRYDPENSLHRLYVALLVASALRFCPPTRRKEVEASLEEIGYHLLRGVLPSGWEVRPFGAHQTLHGSYSGTLFEKYQALAKDIHPLFTGPKDMYDPRDTGDGGLDVVAWHPLTDDRGHIPVLFAQCGCSPQEWEHKQFEASSLQQDIKIIPHHPAMALYIMPHDLRAPNGGWDRQSHVGRIIMIDRSRIVKLAAFHNFAQNLPIWSFVEEAVSLKVPAPR